MSKLRTKISDASSPEAALSQVLLHNKLLEGIIDSNEDRIFALDTNGCFIGFNQSFYEEYQKVLGDAPVIGQKPAYSENTPETSKSLAEAYELAFKGLKAERLVSINNRKILVQATPLYADASKIGGISVYSIDATETIESRKKLKDSQEEFKRIIDNVSDIVFRTDTEGHLIYLNKAWEKITGYTVAESIGKMFATFLQDIYIAEAQILFTSFMKDELESSAHEVRIVAKNGDIKWIKVSVTVLKNEDREIIGTSGIVTDLTEIKRNQHLYELVSTNIEDILLLLETDGTIIYAGAALQQHLGYTQQELIGRKPFDFIHPDEQSLVISRFHVLDETPDNNYLLFRFQHINGTYRWLETHTKLLFDEFYHKKIIIASSRIVDERMEAEQKLLQSYQKEKELNELKSKFVCMASHEFRTPMTSIKSSAEIAGMLLERGDLSDKEKINGFIRTIDQEVDRMSELIDDILNLDKIESRDYFSSKEWLDMVTFTTDCIERQNAKQKDGREMKIEIVGKPEPILADATQMRHILDNLISNAFKYSEGKKEPSLTLIFNAKELQIHIKDHGIGIPAGDKDKVFNIFFRARNTRDIVGTGVGLALVEKFVSMHNGKISFESLENIGTLFVISFPSEK